MFSNTIMRGWCSKEEHNNSHFSRKETNTDQHVHLPKDTLIQHRWVKRVLGQEWQSFSLGFPNEPWACKKSFLNIYGAHNCSQTSHTHHVSCLRGAPPWSLWADVIIIISILSTRKARFSIKNILKYVQLVNGRTRAKILLAQVLVQCFATKSNIYLRFLTVEFSTAPQFWRASCITQETPSRGGSGVW